MQVSRAVEEFLASLATEGRSPHTVAAYRRDLSRFITFTADADISTVTPELLLRFMAHDSVQLRPCGEKRAPATINRYRVTLKALFAWCEARWLIERNPTAILKCKRHRALPPVVLTESEIDKVISYQFSGRHAVRDHTLITFMLLTGCRLGETAALNVGDIDLKAGTATLRCPKGSDPDRIPISPAIIELSWFQNHSTTPKAPLWSTKDRRLSTRQIQRIIGKRMAEAGIKKRVTPHTLRHTFATRLYNRTGDIRLVQQALRHEFITTTQVYAHVDPQRWRQAVSETA